jgi:hypothetical protein
MLGRLVPFANFEAKFFAYPTSRDLCFSVAVKAALRIGPLIRHEISKLSLIFLEYLVYSLTLF